MKEKLGLVSTGGFTGFVPSLNRLNETFELFPVKHNEISSFPH